MEIFHIDQKTARNLETKVVAREMRRARDPDELRRRIRFSRLAGC